MTTKKPKADELELHPHFIYRKTSKIAQRVIGLGITQINHGIKNGSLPQPLNLTGDGRAQGWTGEQLLELQRQRLAKAEAEQRARFAANETSQPPEEDFK